MKNGPRIILVFAFISLVTMSCSFGGQTPSSFITTTATITVTNTSVGIASTPPVSVEIPTQLHTLTPLPTIPNENLSARIEELLQTNGGCMLPCWWGITPGQTSWDEASQFLTSLSAMTIQLDGNVVEVYLDKPDGYPSIEDPYLEYRYNIIDGVVGGMYTYNDDFAEWYNLPNILLDYGAPTYIAISTYRNDFNNSRPTRLILIYAEHGFMLEIVRFTRISNNDEYVEICPGEGGAHFLYTWTPNRVLSFHEIVDPHVDQITGWDPPPILLEDATGMNIEKFMDMFVNPAPTDCISTPIELWPEY